MSGAATLVDVHCHLFNAADIPVRGFARHVALKNGFMSAQLAVIADRLTAGAPGHAADLKRMDALFDGGPEFGSVASLEERVQEQVADAMLELTIEERRLIADELAAVEPDTKPALGGSERFSAGSVTRFVAWAKLFSQSRVDLAVLYARQFVPAAELAIPMLVDLASGVRDDAITGLEQQVELFDRLSEASMHGLLPGAPNLRLHPFVSFDPFRLIDGHRASDGRPIREVIEDALLHRGFAGVKMYPEMGWRPSGNNAAGAGTAERAKRLNKVLDDFFGWCAENSVPITAHCNHSNYSDKAFEKAGNGAPSEWFPVLRSHPGLRVNLGHFGGAHEEEKYYSWAWDIASAMSEFPDRLFGDVGCHPTYAEKVMDTHFGVLRKMVDASPAVARQLLFGTDWYMLAINPRAEGFTSTYRSRFRNEFGDGQADDFMGRNALRFLGFANPSDPSNARLRKRYAELGAARPAWLTAPDQESEDM
ncbi:amidohydrolase family protein [Kribbella sp. C-35]|uniref:amidohydrolase family protein n=1 Tax=Kribbella sp. C-35 TaxID=2789276 RepID=UPI00397E3290